MLPLGKFTVLLNPRRQDRSHKRTDALWVVDTVRIHVRAAGEKSLVTKQHLELLASFLQYEMRNSAENKALVRCVGHLKSFCVTVPSHAHYTGQNNRRGREVARFNQHRQRRSPSQARGRDTGHRRQESSTLRKRLRLARTARLI